MSTLTVLMITGGLGLMFLDHPVGIVLFGTPIVIIVVRLILDDWFNIGGQSFVGYTIGYWFNHFDQKYRWFGWVVIGLIIAAFAGAFALSS